MNIIALLFCVAKIVGRKKKKRQVKVKEEKVHQR